MRCRACNRLIQGGVSMKYSNTELENEIEDLCGVCVNEVFTPYTWTSDHTYQFEECELPFDLDIK